MVHYMTSQGNESKSRIKTVYSNLMTPADARFEELPYVSKYMIVITENPPSVSHNRQVGTYVRIYIHTCTITARISSLQIPFDCTKF
jgi:hypothetical protein